MTLQIIKKTPKNFVLSLNGKKLLVPSSYIQCDNQNGTVNIKKEHRMELLKMY